MKTAAQNVFCVFLLHFSVCFTQKMSISCNLMDNNFFLISYIFEDYMFNLSSSYELVVQHC